METKVIITVLTLFGYGSWIGGILVNWGDWKSAILFWLGAMFMLLKLVRYWIKTYQEYKREEIEQEILRKKVKED